MIKATFNNLQIVKRMEDVELMCEKRKNSLKKLSTQLSRPVNVVSPEPSAQQYQQLQYSAQHERASNKPLLRNGSEGSLMKSGPAHILPDNLSLGGKLVRVKDVL